MTRLTQNQIEMLRVASAALMVAAILAMAIGSAAYPHPGSFNASLATPEIPLLGTWIALGLLGIMAANMTIFLSTYSLNQR